MTCALSVSLIRRPLSKYSENDAREEEGFDG